MTRIPSIAFLLLSLLSLTITTLALNPTLIKNHFFVPPDNHLSQEMYQTRNGIISHSIDNNQSHYVLIDIQSREAKAIVADIITACEVAAPVFQHVHYHVETDSLVYFCPQNTSLLIIDQSSYTTQSSIPFNIQNSYPQAQLSTDGQNVAILCLDTLFVEQPQSSMLVKVDMQTKKVVAEILITTVDPVVAFASNKNTAYIATNNGKSRSQMIIYIYPIVFIGNAYQIGAPLAAYRGQFDNNLKFVTKLFCVGDYIVTNNNQDLYLIYKTGAITQKIPISFKSITADQDGLFKPLMTSTYESNSLYVISNLTSAVRYSFVGPNTLTKQIGSYGDIQVASGNLTSGELMFAIDSSQTNFSILDLQTLEPIYTTVAGCADLILTNLTYSIVQTKNDTDSSIHIFDLSNDTLIANIPINKNYYYTKEQGIFSFFYQTNTSCKLQHINLINGSTWSTRKLVDKYCSNYTITNLRLNIVGSPLYVASFTQDFEIDMYGIGFIQFYFYPKTPLDTIAYYPRTGLDNFYICDANPALNNITFSFYIYDDFYHKFSLNRQKEIANVSANRGFFLINSTMFLALSNDTLTVISVPLFDPANVLEQHSASADWSSATLFQDFNGTDYAILNNNEGTPALWTYGGFIPLPGSRNDSIKAGSAGSQYYWIVDAPSPSVKLARLYDVSAPSKGKTFISI